MKIVTLMEDTKGHELCEYEHGLSLYIETDKHHILFDTGQSDKTLNNAKKLNIDLRKVDIVILSHGHYDHAGGLMAFSKINDHAKIYVHKNVFEDYFHGNKYIGIDKRIKDLPNLHLIDDHQIIDDELSLFTDITGRLYFASGNKELTKRIDGKDIEDSFDHEQCLVIKGEKNILISGCAHNGILNILDKYKEIYSNTPDLVISGFHMNKKEYSDKDIQNIKDVAFMLASMDTHFYTGHCTGLKPYEILKEIMKDKLNYMHSGTTLI